MKSFFDNYVGHFTIGMLLLVGWCVSAQAATVTVTWTNPIQNTDDSAIPATGAGSLSSARIEYGTCLTGGGFGTKAGEVVRPMPATTATLNLQPGSTCVRVTVTNSFNIESLPSNVVTRVIDPPQPKPPVLATVAIAINIPLDSLDGFKRTPAFSITANGPGVLMAFCKVATPSVSDSLFTYRGQVYCKPLMNHPRTGEPNCSWPKGVTPTAEIAAPCA